MKLNTAERWLVNNPARALVQHFYEIPLLRKLGGSVEGGHVLEVGCGRGVLVDPDQPGGAWQDLRGDGLSLIHI